LLLNFPSISLLSSLSSGLFSLLFVLPLVSACRLFLLCCALRRSGWSCFLCALFSPCPLFSSYLSRSSSSFSSCLVVIHLVSLLVEACCVLRYCVAICPVRASFLVRLLSFFISCLSDAFLIFALACFLFRYTSSFSLLSAFCFLVLPTTHTQRKNTAENEQRKSLVLLHRVLFRISRLYIHTVALLR